MFEKWFKNEETAEVKAEVTVEDNVRGVSTDILTTEVAPESVGVVVDGSLVSDVKPEVAPPIATEEVTAAFEQSAQAPAPYQPPQLTYKEAKALKKSRYEDIANNPRFTTSYVLFNKKTGQIVDIKAASSFHACNIIGWKKNQVKVIAVNSQEKIDEASTINK